VTRLDAAFTFTYDASNHFTLAYCRRTDSQLRSYSACRITLDSIINELHSLHQLFFLQLRRDDLNAQRRADVHRAIKVCPCYIISIS
jgi:hypothetical protein